MTSRYPYLIAAVAAVSGLLFGFDTAVINGALIFLREELDLTTKGTEIATSSLLVGCAVGAGFAGVLTDRFGRKRLLLVSLNQMAIVTGILLAYFTSWSLSFLGASSWRWMFGSAVVPSLGFFIALLFVPESPRFLVEKGRETDALGVLRRVIGPEAAEGLVLVFGTGAPSCWASGSENLPFPGSTERFFVTCSTTKLLRMTPKETP